jgi:hypothetical protein
MALASCPARQGQRRSLRRIRQPDYVMTVKANMPTLHKQLKKLPGVSRTRWPDVAADDVAVALLGQLRGIGLQRLVDSPAVDTERLRRSVTEHWRRALAS